VVAAVDAPALFFFPREPSASAGAGASATSITATACTVHVP
jgi:hypothetical protein